MTQHYHPRLHPDLLRHRVGDSYRASRTRSFRDNDYRRALAADLAVLDPATQVIDIKRNFRYDHGFGAASDSHRRRDKSRGAPPHLDKEQPVTRESGVADAIDGLERRVNRGIEAH